MADISGKKNFFSFTPQRLTAYLRDEMDLPAYRADQIFQWVYRFGKRNFDEMTNLKKELRAELNRRFVFPEMKIEQRKVSTDGTRKYLFSCSNGDLVESVMIKQPTRMTLCVSSQVGCAMGCTFCQTGTMGLKRHLTVDEIIGQVLGVIRDAENFGDMFTNMVFMGMGEPLHNEAGVLDAIRILTHDYGLNLSGRKITVSTSGLVPAIKRFAASDVDASLAVSLNATSDEVRSAIMPINKRYPLSELLGALRTLPLKKGRRITMEYVMLKGVNTSDADLARLPRLLRGIPSKINLIPYNFNTGLGFEPPDNEVIQRWQSSLNREGYVATVRWSKGADIDAACGQLVTASKQSKKERTPATAEAPLQIRPLRSSLLQQV